MNPNRKKYQNLLENKNHLIVVSRAHNTIESFENQAQDAFSVERTPLQFYMQRMGQLQIQSQGRGRYNLNYYQNQDNLTFLGQRKMFDTEYEQQENFAILPNKKKRHMIQVPSFFRIYPNVKKFFVKPEKKESLTFPKSERIGFELRNENNFLIERKKRVENLIESINDIKIKAEGKFFYNRPTLLKKNNLEIEYLIIKAPFKTENVSNVIFEKIPKKKRFDNDIQTENKFDINYDRHNYKGFLPEKIYIGTNNNFLIPHQHKKTHFHNELIQAENTSNVFLMKKPKDKSKDQFVIEDMPDIFIAEYPGKRYVSVGMENMTFPGTLRNEFCLEVDFNEEIFVPNVYDMLLIQNFWDNLESESFRICWKPKVLNSKKNLSKAINMNNKENINENKDDLAPIIEGDEKNENNNMKEEEKKEENNETQRRESKSNIGLKKNWKNLTKSVFGKK